MMPIPHLLLVLAAGGSLMSDAQPVLKRSDVVFMYQGDADLYRAYGATVLAWGGTPNERTRAATRDAGVVHFGSVGMVTEFARFVDRAPDYEQAICITASGERLRVPWLWDHSHNGVPAYWFCTRHPLFRGYLRDRVVEVAEAGADGVHVDDHLGTAGNLWLGGCFCDPCMPAFTTFLQDRLAPDQWRDLGVADPAQFNYRDFILQWTKANPDRAKQLAAQPLRDHFETFQLRGAAEFMHELHALAAETAGRPMPMCANVGVPNPNQLATAEAVDFLACEVGQGAAGRTADDRAVFAYKLAEGIARPVCATASGQDWAFINANDLPGLVRMWIVAAYAHGQFFMAPHRQWCYTQELGTHWYQGPTEEYAPLYRFVRRRADLFDDYDVASPVGVLYDHTAYRTGRRDVEQACQALLGAGVPFRIIVSGDERLRFPLDPADLRRFRTVLVPPRDALSEATRTILAKAPNAVNLRDWTGPESIEGLPRPVVVDAENVWALPRAHAQKRAAPIVVHLVNRNYDAAADDVAVQHSITVSVVADALGRRPFRQAHLVRPDAEDLDLPLSPAGQRQEVLVPELGIWALLVLS